jgi:hypothetical protein
MKSVLVAKKRTKKLKLLVVGKLYREILDDKSLN